MKNIVIAFRALRKDLVYTINNLIGLAIGITCCLLILSFVKYETSFDSFHRKKDRIYRVNYDASMGGSEMVSPSVPIFVGPELKKRFPEVEDVTRFMSEWNSRTIRHGNTYFDEKGFAYADPNFFKILDFKVVTGDPTEALRQPNSLVITQTMATKYFGKQDPIGQVLVFNNKKDYVIRSVIEDVPSNSHFTFTFLTSIYNIPGVDSMETQVQWNNPNYTTFVLLKPGATQALVSKKIEEWVNPPGDSHKENSQNSLHLALEPISKAHFDTGAFNFKNMLNVTDFKYISIFITIAILVLLIACANYINLSTAKSSARSKEVGIRKTIGASFSQVFVQFITESFVMVLIAVLISYAAVDLLLPFLNNQLAKQIPFYLFDKDFLLAIVIGTILVSLLAGFYPALVLSRFRPVQTLKGAFTKTGGSGIFVRRGLVVFQFAISIALILGTVIVKSQLDYMQSKKLGLDKEHVISIHGNADIYKKLDAFAADIRKVAGVQDVSITWRSPFETVIGNGFSIKAKPMTNDDWHVVGGIAGDQHYLQTMGIQLLAGRNFDPEKIKGDSTVNEFIVNEAFLRHYQMKPEEVIGKPVILGIAGSGTIVGVMKDFHISSLHEAIGPVVLFNNPQYFSSVMLRVGPGQLPAVIAKIGKLWDETSPMRPFNYTFLDEEYDSLFRTEQRLGTLMFLFCGLAILITCLGLLGMMTFMVAQRTKEIGIRKVLGASVFSITTLLSKDFVKLVAIAIVIAVPFAWYFMNKWLLDFAYRVTVSWYIILATGIVAVLIALITVSFQSIKAAIANPVKSLRTE